MRTEKAQSAKQMALLEQKIDLYKLQLEECSKREKSQKEMSDRVISAFTSNSKQQESSIDLKQKQEDLE